MALKGCCMGAADIVPGVSGGTMAFILGIYQELIASIRSFDLNFLRLFCGFRFREALACVSWKFLATVGLGILTAVFSLARFIEWLLENQPVLIWSFFLGLILGSVVTVGRRMEKWSPVLLVWSAAGAAAAYVVTGMVPLQTPDTEWSLFISGAVAICAMILPGISGAFILVLLGKYHYILKAVNDHDFMALVWVAVGACTGLAAFSRLLNWLFTRYHDIAIAILAGLMAGSLRKVWPWKEVTRTVVDSHGRIIDLAYVNILPECWNAELITATVLVSAGLVVVLVMDYLGEV
ncbi:MAG TPA: DUF368 domain-containing protein [Thermodesulfobacteriaceae bacterium]|nr:DUF368 domain-containing protein [Thermodesulfobacteriaceae bacterium]